MASIRALLLFFFLFCIGSILSAQPVPHWDHYVCGQLVYTICDDGDDLLLGTSSGLIRMNKVTGHQTFYVDTTLRLGADFSTHMRMGDSVLFCASRLFLSFRGKEWSLAEHSRFFSVQCMAKDSSGNLWFGTTGSELWKLNGATWTKYNKYNSDFTGGAVTALAVTQNGSVWIGTSDGMWELNSLNEWRHYDKHDAPFAFHSPEVSALAADGDTLWIGTAGDVIQLYNRAVVSWRSTRQPVKVFVIDHRGRKWVGTRSTLMLFDNDKWTDYGANILSPRPQGFVNALIVDSEGVAWIGTAWGGLVRFDGITWKSYLLSNANLPSINFPYAAIDSSGTAWFAGDYNTVVSFDGEKWVRHDSTLKALLKLTDEDDIFDLTNICVDRQGNVWIAVGFNGLVKYDGTTWTHYDSTNALIPLSGYGAMGVDRSGTLWFGVSWEDYGLTSFDGEQWRSYPKPDSFLFIKALAVDGNDHIWLATDTAVAEWDGMDWTLYRRSAIGPRFYSVTSIFVDSHNRKWLGTRGGSLFVYDGEWKEIRVTNDNLVSVQAEDSDGTLWIASTTGGIYHLRNDSLSNPYPGGYSEPYSGNIHTIMIDSRERKWITGGKGITVLTDKLVPTSVPESYGSVVPVVFSPVPMSDIGTCTISLPEQSSPTYVHLELFDAMGRSMGTILHERMSGGVQSRTVDCRSFPVGVYYYRLTIGGGIQGGVVLIAR